jgi:ribosomal protein S12 methylthiotransferase accessory factor
VTLRRSNGDGRSEAIADVLPRLRDVAARLGVTRTSDITRLDRLGLPVCVAIRPNAVPGSLCVHAGKGFRPEEALAGALAEAIEFACAEAGPANPEIRPIAAAEVLDGRILDLCPLLGRAIDPRGLVAAMRAVSVRGSRESWVPAELVLHPFAQAADVQAVFGSSTNGLAVGASLTDALVQGICEVLERDVLTFERVRPAARALLPDDLPEEIARVRASAESVGLRLAVQCVPNEFGLPFFAATLSERDALDPLFVCGGYGLHPSRELALRRAVAEAAQSRLSFVHGARDDVPERRAELDRLDEGARRDYAAALLKRPAGEPIAFGAIPDGPDARDPDDLLTELCAATERAGVEDPLFVRLDGAALPLAVVRVIVPRCEHFVPGLPRVGPRLAARIRREEGREPDPSLRRS